MTDIVDPDTRSRMMSGIRGKDTRPERFIRSFLHRSGFRFRLHVRSLPGAPDLVLSKYRAIVFVHGCFWHRHAGCRYSTIPASRKEFWLSKFASNVERDHRHQDTLLDHGWRVAIVWECGIRHDPESILPDLVNWLCSGRSKFQEFPKTSLHRNDK